MASQPASWARFVDALAPLRRAGAEASRARLEQRLADAQAAWPDVEHDEGALAEHLAAVLPEGAPLDEALERLHVEDLALALALRRGDRAALSAFEQQIVPGLERALRRAGAEPSELLQDLRVRVLVEGDGGAPPKIADYRGTGPLRAWLRVAALRAAVNKATRPPREMAVADSFFEALATAPDPTSELVVRDHASSVKDALRGAIATLSNRERGLLQYAFVDGVSLERIGALYRVHRSTVTRWIDLARERLRQAVEEDLRARLHASPSEVESVVKHVSGALDSSIESALARRS